MKWRDITEDGRIVKGVNTTADVDTNEIPRQAAKFGNKVDKDGKPPTLSKKVKGKSTNVLFNLGLAERFTPMEIALMEGGHSIEVYRRNQLPQIKNKQLSKIKHTVETVKLTDIIPVQEERIVENFKRQVDKIVAGEYKPIIVDKNYKIVNGHHRYTALQMLKYENVQVAVLPWTLEKILEKWSKKYKNSINCSNPKGFSQKAHCAGKKKNENFAESSQLDSLRKFVRSQREAPDQVLYQIMMAPDTYGHSVSDFVRSWYEKTKEENGLNDVDSALEIMVDELGLNENYDHLKGHGTDVPLGKYLYHVTYAEALEGMLEDGHMNVKGPAPFHYADYFSMTADPKYSVAGRPEVQIIIDAARVSKMETFEKYVDDWESTPGAGDWAKGDDGDWESEYRVEETIPLDYIVAVKILKSKTTPEIIKLAKKRGVKLVGKDTNVLENFADGKKKGKSRPGRVKRAGASCNGSVTSLRKRAKNSSGEKAKMYHWCANMKSGRKKK